MTIRYRASLGRNLTPSELDENFSTLVSDVAAVEGGAADGVGVDDVTVSGNVITFVMSDASTIGPFTIPVPTVPDVVEMSDASYTLDAADVGTYIRCTYA